MVRGNDKRFRERSQTEYLAPAIQVAPVGWGFPGRQEVSREQKPQRCLECGVGGLGERSDAGVSEMPSQHAF